MIEKMVSEAKPFLPLKITDATWNGIGFNVFGPKWAFFTLGSWRLSKGNKILFSCYDKAAKNISAILAGEKIVDIKIQENILKIDPLFILADGKKIEIFSTDTYEAWTFNVEGLGCFVATPSEPHLFDSEYSYD